MWLSRACRRQSLFTMYAKPASVSDHEPHESSAHLHNPSLYDFLQTTVPLTMLEHTEFSSQI